MITYNYTTTSKTILADLYTPVGVYMRLRDLYPQSALMESSDYHEKDNSRSFIGIEPMASVAIGHGMATITYPDGTTLQHEVNKDYRSDKAIHELIDRIHVEGDDAKLCGLFGYTSFNAVRYFEDINVKDETQAKNDAPDLLYILYKVVIVFDHFNNTIKLVSLEGETKLDDVVKAMNKANVKAYDFHPPIHPAIRGRRFQTVSCPAFNQPKPLSVLLRLWRFPYLRFKSRNPLSYRRP